MKGGVFPNKSGVGAPWILRFQGVFKRYWSKELAEAKLSKMRIDHYEGQFDKRDYQKDRPLGFSNLANKWLAIKKGQVKCFRNLRYHMVHCQSYYGQRNIKDIKFAELEDFLLSLPKSLSDKSKANIFTTLHSFFVWCVKRNYLDRIPDWPEIKYELGWRATVDKQTQGRIIEEVRRISYDINPKIWFGIFLLASFPRVRPGELRVVKESDVDLKLGIIWIRHTKEGKEKKIFLLEEDIEFIEACQTALPHMPFFRHMPHRKGVSRKHYEKNGGMFGPDLFLKWWNRACENLGVEGVPLYPGTKHSTATAALDHMTPEEIQLFLTGHTSKAFYRYLVIDRQRQVDASRKIRGTRGKAEVVRLERRER